MKKFALIAAGIVAVNTVANLSLDATKAFVTASGGTLAGALYLAAPLVVTPAPLAYVRAFARG
jgi:hypothetical protein